MNNNLKWFKDKTIIIIVNKMNILDLNDDIMSKIKHNLFLKSLMKHRNEFEFDFYDWNCWELERDLSG